jgi:solute carrier family 27 fatty acid transporter 1/4
VAHYLVGNGFSHGDSLALFMENRPEYIGLWLGCAKAGVVPALINYNLRGQSLLHSINSAFCTAIVFGGELTAAVCDIQAELGRQVKLLSFGPSSSGPRVPGAASLDHELPRQPVTEVPEAVSKRLSFRDKVLYIYTSGTTGLPKAAVVKNSRCPAHLLRKSDYTLIHTTFLWQQISLTRQMTQIVFISPTGSSSTARGSTI